MKLEDYYTKNELKEELTNILPYATKSNTGWIKIDGSTITIDENGVISVNFNGSDSTIEDNVLEIIKNNVETENLDFSEFFN